MNVSDLTSTELAILALLRTQDINGKDYAPIPGRIHLVKEIFAIRETNIGRQLLDELEFEADNFGPFDETVFAALDELSDANLVGFTPSKGHSKIVLTDQGKHISDEIWEKLRDDIKSIISYVKLNFNHISSKKLLDKIYSAYPDMAI